MSKRLVIIDGKSVFYRGYFAMPSLSLPDGTPIGGVFGFASIAIEAIKRLEPDYIAIAWDIKGTSITKRTEIYPDYKAGRTKPPEDFYEQLPALREVLEAFNWPLYELEHYEADDIIGSFARQANQQDIEVAIVSGDYDMLQLLGPQTSVYITKRGGTDLTRYDNQAFRDRYGVEVEQFIDYKALVGDPSDNIPGIRGIGPKAAEKLLNSYQNLDGIYAHVDELKGAQQQKIIAGRDDAYMSQKLAAIYTDAPIEFEPEDADINRTNLDKVMQVLKKFEFNSLIKRLPSHMQHEDHPGLYVANKLESLSLVEWSDEVDLDERVTCFIHQEKIYLSPNRSQVMVSDISQVKPRLWSMLGMVTVIGYDLKELLHQLAKRGVQTEIDEVHDLRQAAFLLNPLQRDRSLEGLIGNSLAMDDPGQVLAAIWSVYDAQILAFKERPHTASIATELDFPLVRLLFNIEQRGVKIDTDFFELMNQDLARDYQAAQQKIYNLVGHEFNIGSPAQLSEVLFTKLQLPTAGIKKGKTAFSTGQKELDKLRGQHPIIELIEQARELAKMKNTYVEALPKLVDENSRLHTTFNQDVASTGRLSSTNPNLQNIPIRSDLGRRLRQGFIAEPGKVLVSADYSQFELRLAAILSGDQELIDDFNSGIDIHTKTASTVYGVAMEQVTKNQRRDAKVINFGVLYGMSPHGLSVATGMSLFEAKQFIDNYFARRSAIRQFIDQTLRQADEIGYVETFYGRRRPTPDVKSSNFIVREAAKRAAANMPIQGTEADLMKRAMIKLEAALGQKGQQILQIHDSILVECPEANAAEVGKIMQTVMEDIAPELQIALKVDVAIGKTWGDL